MDFGFYEINKSITRILKDKKIVAAVNTFLRKPIGKYELSGNKGKGFEFYDGEIYLIFGDKTALRVRWIGSGYLEYIEKFKDEDPEIKELIDKIIKNKK